MNNQASAKVLSGSKASLIQLTMNLYTKLNIFVYRRSGGRFMNTFPGGYPICIVSVRGRKTQTVREVPLLHLPYMDKKILLASQGGLPKNPAWYYNIREAPRISITVYGKTKSYDVVEMTDEDKAEFWPHILSMYPDFELYSARTERNIPIFLCSPLSCIEAQ